MGSILFGDRCSTQSRKEEAAKSMDQHDLGAASAAIPFPDQFQTRLWFAQGRPRNKEISNLEKKVKDLEKEKKELQRRNKKLTGRVEELEMEIEACKKKIKLLMDEVAELKETTTKLVKSNKKLEDTVTLLQVQMETVNDQMAESMEKEQELRDQLSHDARLNQQKLMAANQTEKDILLLVSVADQCENLLLRKLGRSARSCRFVSDALASKNEEIVFGLQKLHSSGIRIDDNHTGLIIDLKRRQVGVAHSDVPVTPDLKTQLQAVIGGALPDSDDQKLFEDIVSNLVILSRVWQSSVFLPRIHHY